jgi:hypothetical protein
MQDDKTLAQILRRLDILIVLELQKSPGVKNVPIAGRIHRLAELGLTASEIASILGKPVNYITATLSRQKKAGEKTGRVNSDRETI